MNEGDPFCSHCGHAVDAPAGGRRKKGLLIAGIAAGIVLIVGAAVGVVLLLGGSSSPKHDLAGSITVDDFDSYYTLDEGDSCSGEGGYSDIGSGLSVKVADGKGQILGTGALSSGKAGSLATCVFTFNVSDLPETDFYSVTIGGGRRGELSYSKEEMEAQDWTVSLTLGD